VVVDLVTAGVVAVDLVAAWAAAGGAWLCAQGSSRHFAWMWRSDLCSILLLWFLSLLMFV